MSVNMSQMVCFFHHCLFLKCLDRGEWIYLGFVKTILIKLCHWFFSSTALLLPRNLFCLYVEVLPFLPLPRGTSLTVNSLGSPLVTKSVDRWQLSHWNSPSVRRMWYSLCNHRSMEKGLNEELEVSPQALYFKSLFKWRELLNNKSMLFFFLGR